MRKEYAGPAEVRALESAKQGMTLTLERPSSRLVKKLAKKRERKITVYVTRRPVSTVRTLEQSEEEEEEMPADAPPTKKKSHRPGEIPEEGGPQGLGQEDGQEFPRQGLPQLINFTHLMPTRYTLDVDLKEVVSGAPNSLTTKDKKLTAAKSVKAKLEERFKPARVGGSSPRSA
ncbi:60S ribosomal protein L27-3 [Hordeum vulgare]|nr:60S ribosomal protein L27-3 [Hordeum vulgare]